MQKFRNLAQELFLVASGPFRFNWLSDRNKKKYENGSSEYMRIFTIYRLIID